MIDNIWFSTMATKDFPNDIHQGTPKRFFGNTEPLYLIGKAQVGTNTWFKDVDNDQTCKQGAVLVLR